MLTINRLANFFLLKIEAFYLITKPFTITVLAISFFSCTAPMTYKEIKVGASKLQSVSQKKKVTKTDVAEAWTLVNEAKQLVIMLEAKKKRASVKKAEIDKAKRVAKQAEKLALLIQEKFKKQASQISGKKEANQKESSSEGKFFDDNKNQMPFGISVDALPKNFDPKYLKK